AASRSASTSAWPIGSASASRRFAASARISPSGPNTTAPTGTSPGGVRRATSIAARMRPSSRTSPSRRGSARPPSGLLVIPAEVEVVDGDAGDLGQHFLEAELAGDGVQLLGRPQGLVLADHRHDLLRHADVGENRQVAL